MYNELVKSIVSGVLIAVSSYMYINADNKMIAAFLFPLALITIIKQKSNLFTGKIGKVKFNLDSLKFISIVLIGNIIGSMILLPFYSNEYSVFMMNKINQDYWLLFGKAIFCGMLMNIAVSYTNGGKDFLLTIMCVAGFLIGKCEHSIADICYVMISHSFNIETLYFILIVLLGNTVGAIFVERLFIKNYNNEH